MLAVTLLVEEEPVGGGRKFTRSQDGRQLAQRGG
jgi:hypothetical protein